jgi:Uncharacterised nucleotidyltransferase
MSASALQNEWGFLCACVSPAANVANLSALVATKLNWEGLVDLAEAHGVAVVLAKRLRASEMEGVPRNTQEKLQNRIRTQQFFSLGMTAELFRILRGFSAAGIETVLVKGPITSLLAYDDPAARSYVDLDLLIRQRDSYNARQCMLALGFHADIPETAMRAEKIPGEYLFQKPSNNCTVELHTEHTFRYYPKPMRIEELFARKRTMLLDGREIPALSLENELVLNCIHSAKHFWERLMWVSDVAAIVAKHPEIDWQKARQAAAEVGASRILRVGVQVGAMLFGMDLPAAMADEIRKDRTSEALCRQILTWLPYAGTAPPPLPQRALFRLRMAGAGITGSAYLMRLSLSPTQEDWKAGEEERRSWLWDAVRRPFRLLRKYGSSSE